MAETPLAKSDSATSLAGVPIREIELSPWDGYAIMIALSRKCGIFSLALSRFESVSPQIWRRFTVASRLFVVASMDLTNAMFDSHKVLKSNSTPLRAATARRCREASEKVKRHHIENGPMESPFVFISIPFSKRILRSKDLECGLD